jgi:DNA-binding CsgD family transcriptional regulator
MRHDPLLTPRETEVLLLYARLADWRLVALEMGIGLQSTKNLASLAYQALGVSNAIGAFRELDWLQVPYDPLDEEDVDAPLRRQMTADAEAGAQ